MSYQSCGNDFSNDKQNQNLLSFCCKMELIVFALFVLQVIAIFLQELHLIQNATNYVWLIFCIISLSLLKNADTLFHPKYEVLHKYNKVMIISAFVAIFHSYKYMTTVHNFYKFSLVFNIFLIAQIIVSFCKLALPFLLGQCLSLSIPDTNLSKKWKRLTWFTLFYQLIINASYYFSLMTRDFSYTLSFEEAFIWGFILISPVLCIIALVLFHRTSQFLTPATTENPNPLKDFRKNTRYERMQKILYPIGCLLLIFSLQLLLRDYFENQAVNSTKKEILNHPITLSEISIETGSITTFDSNSIIGYLPSDEFTCVSTMDELMEAMNSENGFVVLKLFKEKMIPVGQPYPSYIVANNEDSLIYNSLLLSEKNWMFQDYEIILQDGTNIYASYSKAIIDALGDGEITLPIGKAFYCKDLPGNVSSKTYLSNNYNIKYRETFVPNISFTDKDPSAIYVAGRYGDYQYFHKKINRNMKWFFVSVLALILILMKATYLLSSAPMAISLPETDHAEDIKEEQELKVS